MGDALVGDGLVVDGLVGDVLVCDGLVVEGVADVRTSAARSWLHSGRVDVGSKLPSQVENDYLRIHCIVKIDKDTRGELRCRDH